MTDAEDVGGELVPVQPSNTLARIQQARQWLAEARALPDLKVMIEAVGRMADMAKSEAKIAEMRGLAASVVEQANLAANEAAIVRIEAQSRAGNALVEMAERGERHVHGYARPGEKATLATLGITKMESLRWRQVAKVPESVREGYFRDVEQRRGEVSTNGLLHYAEQKAAEAVKRTVNWKPVDRLQPEILAPAADVAPRYREQLLRAAVRQKWTPQQVAEAAEVLLDPDTDEAVKTGYLNSLSRAPETTTPRASAGERSSRFDFAGPDVAERHDRVPVKITIGPYQLPSDKTRQRGILTYEREQEWHERRFETSLSAVEVVDVPTRGGDPLHVTPFDPRYGLHAIFRRLQEQAIPRLQWEGWPKQDHFGDVLEPPRG